MRDYPTTRTNSPTILESKVYSPSLLSEAFPRVVLDRFVEHNEAGDWVLCAYEDPVRPKGKLGAAKLSAWSLSADGATLDLFVSLYLNEDVPPSVPRAEAAKHFKLLRASLFSFAAMQLPPAE